MLVRSVPAYHFSISRMNLVLRVLLISSSALPFVPFIFMVQTYLPGVSTGAAALALLAAAVVFIPAHEAMHGLIFWLYRRRVTFGYKAWTAFGPVFYAASVGSRFSRRQYQLACVAPQFLTILLIAITLLRPNDAVAMGAAYAAAMNLGGGVVDMFVFILLFSFPKNAVVEDANDGMQVYLKVPEHA